MVQKHRADAEHIAGAGGVDVILRKHGRLDEQSALEKPARAHRAQMHDHRFRAPFGHATQRGVQIGSVREFHQFTHIAVGKVDPLDRVVAHRLVSVPGFSPRRWRLSRGDPS
jgi:hypothetical protein